MKKLLLFFIIVFNFGNAQTNKFEVSTDGNSVNSYVVTNVDGKSAAELYKKTLEWINKNYDNPDKVIKAHVENDYIRIEGIKKDMFKISNGKSNYIYDGKYQIEFSFKDGKYKVEVVDLINLSSSSFHIALNNIQDVNRGNIKAPLQTETIDTFNSLNDSLKDYINGVQAKKDNW